MCTTFFLYLKELRCLLDRLTPREGSLLTRILLGLLTTYYYLLLRILTTSYYLLLRILLGQGGQLHCYLGLASLHCSLRALLVRLVCCFPITRHRVHSAQLLQQHVSCVTIGSKTGLLLSGQGGLKVNRRLEPRNAFGEISRGRRHLHHGTDVAACREPL